MEPTTNSLSQDDKAALCQMQQKSSNLRQSSSNHFLVALEGLMLAAIAWESIGKPKAWLSNLSKATTAIGLGVAGLFTFYAVRDKAQASKIDTKLKQYGMDELTLPCEIKTEQQTIPPIQQPKTTLQAGGREVSRLQDAPAQQLAV